MLSCDHCGKKWALPDTSIGEECGVRLDSAEWCDGKLVAATIEAAARKLLEALQSAQTCAACDRIVNWMAAMWADPGIMSCPGCSVHLWAEGHTAKCPDCGHEWRTREGLRHDEQAAKRAQREASR